LIWGGGFAESAHKPTEKLMADDVTKKDLQSLQGYCNNKIGEVNKRIDNACKAVNDLSKRVDTNNTTLVGAVNDSTQAAKENNNTLAKRVAELEARVAALEK
jgi:predicted phage tail protein